MKIKNLTLIIMITFFVSCGAKKSNKQSSSSVDTSQEDGTDAEAKESNPVNLTFVSPKSDKTLLVKNYVEIEIKITDPAPSSTWALYYTKEKESIAEAIAIAEELSIDQTKFTWDTSFTPAGSYYILATVTDKGHDTLFFYDQLFEINGSNDGNTAPIAVINFPIGDKTFAPNEVVPISFAASDPDGDEITGKLEYTSDGTNWNIIDDKLDLSSSLYNWTINNNAPQTARYRLRLTVSDSKKESIGLNDIVFGVTANPVTYTGALATAIASDCNKCHSGANVNGGFNSSTYSSFASKQDSVLKRTREGAASPMPPSTEGSLAVQTRDLIQLWIWGGAQN
ncbi:MAG: hypothetical protein R3B45_06440 [Bdellovibrionota bacterium]